MIHHKARHLSEGMRIRVRALGSCDEWSMATVGFCSASGKSVALRLDGGVRSSTGGFFAGILAVLIDHKTGSVSDLFGGVYEIGAATRRAVA